MANPKVRNPAKPKLPVPRNNIEGDIHGGAFVQGDNHGTVIAIGSDKTEERLGTSIDGLIDRLLSDLESNYKPKGGGKE